MLLVASLTRLTIILSFFINFIYVMEVGGYCSISKDGIDVMGSNSNTWSEAVEGAMSRHFFSGESLNYDFHVDLSGKYLVGTREGCGRMHNRLGVLSTGEKICLRYRDNVEQIQGDLMSYAFAKVFGFQNLVDMKLLFFNKTDDFWSSHARVSDYPWEDLRFVTATKYLEESRPVYAPRLLLQNDFTLTRNTSLCGLEMGEVLQLMQWSDMIVFDYLIGNFDRYVSNMFNLQWHSQSLAEPVENLIQLKNGFWLFIDNEEGFSHGYRLLEKYEPFLRKLLKNVCLFRKQTVKRIEQLSRLNHEEISNLIWIEVKGCVSLEDHVDVERFPKLSYRNLAILKTRIDFLHKHFSGCGKQECVENINL